VARAIVVPKDGNVPMRMLNMDHQPVTIYKGTKITLAEAVDNIREVCAVNEKQHYTLTEQEKEEMLSNVLSTMPETLTDQELKQFCALISSFAHIFATKSDDLGRTSILKHKIETSGNPIRQDYLCLSGMKLENYCVRCSRKRSLHHPRVLGHPPLYWFQRKMSLYIFVSTIVK